jgi:protein-L-isoaspartate(D-aspartate) O-methyltransferase
MRIVSFGARCIATIYCTAVVGSAGIVGVARAQDEKNMDDQREKMVERQIERRGVENARVLQALRDVKRHLFVPSGEVESAYEDHPLSIGHGQTISQPYIVALMTEAIEPQPTDRVLEIGTGSGYQAAVLSKLVKEVYSIEIVEPLGRAAAERLKTLGYDNVTVRVGDGYKGWPEKAPFDAIVVTAAPPEIPQALVDQLAEGGSMVLPVGTAFQELMLVEKKKGGEITKRVITAVRFVPMVKGKETEKKE